jgi:hypothetical protein
MSAGFAAVLAEIASMRGQLIGPVQPTAAEFAADLRGMLEGLAWQAGHGRRSDQPGCHCRASTTPGGTSSAPAKSAVISGTE